MFKRLKGIIRAILGDKPMCIYNCQLSGASYCMHPHGKGFAVERTMVLGDMSVTKTVSVVEAGGSQHDLARRFLDIVERDANRYSMKQAA